MSCLSYRETLWSELYDGSRPSVSCLVPAVAALESLLEIGLFDPPAESWLELGHPERIEWRLDGGFGSDKNLQYLLERNYHLTAKGFSGKRAQNLAKQVKRWTKFGDVWLGLVPSPLQSDRPLTSWVKRRKEPTGFRHSYYVTTRRYPSISACQRAYNQRGAAEIEQFRNDKQGLHLSARRKRKRTAQTALLLLTDLTHNLLAHFYQTALADSTFAEFGLQRIVRDLLAIEGRLVVKNGQLLAVQLAETHPHTQALLPLLRRFLDTDLPR